MENNDFADTSYHYEEHYLEYDDEEFTLIHLPGMVPVTSVGTEVKNKSF